ncbi:fungal hydrophobin-domain-containing protein [Crassisporium funariophilum]|nr:fungal hydrophobin-domain-containing protein [Crassisporium funariophilum]
MFARVYTLFFFLFAALPLFVGAAALPGGPQTPPPANNQCNTGTISCCNSLQNASSSGITSILGLLGVVVGSVTGQVGVNCSPISVVGVGGNSCSAQPVCCTGNSFNGIINLGCSPINLNL